MKRFILSITILFAFTMAAFAQDMNEFMTKVSKIEGVETQVVDKEMINMAMQNGGEAPSFIHKVDSIVVVAVEDANPDIIRVFDDMYNNYTDGNGYETFVKINDGEDRVLIVSRKENDVFKEFFILAISDDEEVALIKMAGNFNESDMAELTKQQANN